MNAANLQRMVALFHTMAPLYKIPRDVLEQESSLVVVTVVAEICCHASPFAPVIKNLEILQ